MTHPYKMPPEDDSITCLRAVAEMATVFVLTCAAIYAACFGFAYFVLWVAT